MNIQFRSMLPHVYVWQDSFVSITTDSYKTWLILGAHKHSRSMLPHSYETWCIPVCHDSYMWNCPFIYDMSHFGVQFHLYDMTHFCVVLPIYMWHDPFLCDMSHFCVTWLIFVWTWPIHMWHDSCWCGMTDCRHAWISNLAAALWICVTSTVWLQMFDILHFICDTTDCRRA